MRLPLTPGKLGGLKAVSDSRRIIAALAIDQRSALCNMIAKAKGVAPDSIPAEPLVEFKEAVSRHLTPYASAVLLDPLYGLPASRLRANDVGLLLAYERSGYDKNCSDRKPHLLDDWSVLRLVESGADCIKILLYYSPTSARVINSHKQAWVERIGQECRGADVPFFLELVGYREGMDDTSQEFARVKPHVITTCVQEFSKPRYFVDVLKVGVPVDMAYVEGSPTNKGVVLYSREEAKRHFRAAAAAAQIPFIYLSEGARIEAFADALTLATEAGAGFSGVLCGRAIWKDGVPIYVNQGVTALQNWLKTDGVRNIQAVNECLGGAKPWQAAVDSTGNLISTHFQV